MEGFNWIWYAVLVVVFAYSLYSSGHILNIYMRRSASRQWTLTTGKVIDKRVVTRLFRVTGSGSSIPQITYRYSVLGTEYKKKVSLGSMWGNKNAENVLAQVGDTVNVRYNPQRPGQNIIDEEQVSSNDILSVVVLWVIIIFFLYSFYSSGEFRPGTSTPSAP